MWRRYSAGSQAHPSHEELAARIVRRGAVVSLLIPVILCSLAFALREAGLGLDEIERPPVFPVLLYSFVALGIMELVGAFVLRKVMLTREKVAALPDGEDQRREYIVRASTVVLTVGAAPIIYGIVLYLLGGSIQEVAYFALLNLLSFRLLRPDTDWVEKLLSTPRDAAETVGTI